MTVSLSIVEDIVRSKPQTSVKPREFFLAYQGVPTLAYEGFSVTLLEIKREIQNAIPGLRTENRGSLWPKTTLGALRDDATLSWEQAFTLKEICTLMNANVRTQDVTFDIPCLSIVLFQCRSLEKRLVTCPIYLQGKKARLHDSPPRYHTVYVENVMAQFSEQRLVDYLEHLQSSGNRESDYRRPWIEATLIYDLPEEQPTYIEEFIKEVDKQLPDLYRWFEPSSRHMTVRALVGNNEKSMNRLEIKNLNLRGQLTLSF